MPPMTRPASARNTFLLRVHRRGGRLQLELVDLRNGEHHQPDSLRALWRLMQRLLQGLDGGLH